jgi:hypothetical protein
MKHSRFAQERSCKADTFESGRLIRLEDGKHQFSLISTSEKRVSVPPVEFGNLGFDGSWLRPMTGSPHLNSRASNPPLASAICQMRIGFKRLNADDVNELFLVVVFLVLAVGAMAQSIHAKTHAFHRPRSF